jgi:hypothetical protein
VTKEKNLKIKSCRHCNFCGKDGHVKSNFFKKMEASKVEMKEKKISIDSSTSSHGHALSTFGFSFNATSSSSFDE